MSVEEEFSSVELAIVQEILFDRYSRVIRIEQGDAEIDLHGDANKLTPCSAIYWEMEFVGFVVFKLGKDAFRCQFFYDSYEQFNTGRGEFANLTECVRTLLHTQAQHHAQRTTNTDNNSQLAN